MRMDRNCAAVRPSSLNDPDSATTHSGHYAQLIIRPDAPATRGTVAEINESSPTLLLGSSINEPLKLDYNLHIFSTILFSILKIITLFNIK